MAEKSIGIKAGVEIYKKSRSFTLDRTKIETEGGVDTLFDTYYDDENKTIVFGSGCAYYDQSKRTLAIEGAVKGRTLVIS